MRFSFLVAAEIFFLSLFCVGCDGCRGIEDVKSGLTTLFSKPENIMNHVDFKFRKDSTSGLLHKANIDISGELEVGHKFLLCLEEFMYVFRSLFEDKINVKSGQQDLFDIFCKYVAERIKSDNKEFNDNNLYAKREKLCEILFLNLCKLFFIDAEEEIWEDVRDFRIIFNLFHVDGHLLTADLGFFIDQVCNLLYSFIGEKLGQNISPIFIDPFNSELLEFDTILECSQFFKKESFYIENFSRSGQLMRKRSEKHIGTVLLYNDFLVFDDTKSKKETVWKREPKNKATPYSFYRLLSEEEIREIDIFAKDPERKVIDILEGKIREQMLYDAERLYCEVNDFINLFTPPENMWESLLDYCKKDLNEFLVGENVFNKIFEKKNKDFEAFFVEYLEILGKEKLTDDIWVFSIRIRNSFLKKISDVFKGCLSDFDEPWFNGLINVGNSCYINSLSQILFEYREEMKGLVNEKFLKIMSKFQDERRLSQEDKDFLFGITGYTGYQADAYELFGKVFTLGGIKKKLTVLDNDNSDINCKDNVKKQRATYESFVFRFSSEFSCIESYADKEKLDFKEKFNSDKKKQIKSLQDVLRYIYDYLKENFDGLSLVCTNIVTLNHTNLSRNSCKNKYSIQISPVKGIEIDSYPVCNGCDLSQFINKLKWGKKEMICSMCNHTPLCYETQVYYNFSDFLVMCLKRYGGNLVSLPNNIPIPDNICFGSDRYDITGIVCHSGDFYSGHYVAYKKVFGFWVKFDDETVSIVGPSLSKEVVKNTYMLFFKKHKKIKDEGKAEIKEGERKKKGAGNMSRQEVNIKKREETERRRMEEEERKRNEKLNLRCGYFLSELLQYYSSFKKRYFENKNKEGKFFVEYLNDIVKDKADTKTLLGAFLNNKNNKDLEKQLYAFLLLQVQNYCNLSKSIIKEKDRNSKNINETHEEKANREELESLAKDIIMLISKDPSLQRFSNESSTSFFLKEFVKAFFIIFCDFDNTCEKPLFKNDTLQSLKNGDVEFFFTKDKNINIPDNRDLPFFLIDPTAINDQQNDVGKDNFEENGETIPAGDEDDKYYCFWSDKLIITGPKKKKGNNNNLLDIDKNEIKETNEGNKINIDSHHNVDADYNSFENRALFKKTFEVRGCGFFERLPDEECSKYVIKNIVEDVQSERKQKLDRLLSFIEKIKVFIKDFIGETDKEIEECQKNINNKDFFAMKKKVIEEQYEQQIEDIDKRIDIANKYKEAQGFGERIDQYNVKIKNVKEQIDQIKKKIAEVKQLEAGVQPNTQGGGTKSKCGGESETQVSGEKNNVSIQSRDYKEKLEKKRRDLYSEKISIENSMRQFDRVANRFVTFIVELEEEKKKMKGMLEKGNNIDFETYKARLDRYFSYYKEKNKGFLNLIGLLQQDIKAVLDREKGYVFQSLEIKNINSDDIINVFNSYLFDIFVLKIKEKIREIISGYSILDFYKYLCFGDQSFRNVLVGREQRFKGLVNIGNTCYINSILQNLVEFKDDLLIIKDLPHEEKFRPEDKTIHDTIFSVLGEKDKDPRIGLHNVLNISIARGFNDLGDPADVYSSLLNYYINKSYRIEVVQESEEKDFVYEHLRKEHPSSYNAKVVLPSVAEGGKKIKDIDIIGYLYNNGDFKKNIKRHIPVSQGTFVFENMIIRKYCQECKKEEITIEIQCLPFCHVYKQFKVDKISDVVKGSFDIVTEEEEQSDIECDFCRKKIAKVKRSSCYKILNNCLCFQFVYKSPNEKNFIDIEDEVKVGDEVYESVCACYYNTSHYIAFKKINGIWFRFNDNDVSPIIYESLPKMYGGYKPTLVFYKKKIKDKK